MARTTKGRIFQRGKNWYVQYYLAGRQIVQSLRTTDAREAKRLADERLAGLRLADQAAQAKAAADRLAGTEQALAAWQEETRPRLAVADAWGRYEDDTGRPDSGPRTLQDCRLHWGAFVRWLNEAHPDVLNMEAVTPAIADEYARSLTSLTANTFNKRTSFCRLLFKTLAPACGNMANPFANIRPKRLVTIGRRELSEAELQRVCQAATGDLRTLFAIGLYSALRLGDAATLRWAEVNFRAGVIVRAPNKTARRHPGKLVKIPLHPSLRAILEETPAEARREYVMPKLAAQYLRSHPTVSRRIQAHFTACGIVTSERRPGRARPAVLVGFHSLRHSFVSLCADKGVPLSIVQELCGHGSPAIQRHYIHVGAEAARNAISTLPSLTPEPTAALPAGTKTSADPDALRRAVIAAANSAPPDALRRALELLEDAQ